MSKNEKKSQKNHKIGKNDQNWLKTKIDKLTKMSKYDINDKKIDKKDNIDNIDKNWQMTKIDKM